MKKIFLDCETTSLNPATGQIVEIAIIDDTGRCMLSTRYNVDYSQKLQPIEEIEAALEYNKLTKEILALYRPINKFDLSTIEAILNSADSVVAHNAPFEKAFLESTSERVLGYNCFKGIDWVCSMELLAKSKGIKSGRVKLPNMQLDNIPHSALEDARNCRLLYKSLTEKSNDWIW